LLVIISDTHLTDGSSGETVREQAFAIFRDRLRDLAYDASWMPNGVYKPIEELDLVLLGDILDVIRSTKWLEDENTRPWSSDQQAKPFTDKIAAITAGILQENAKSLAILKSLNDGKTITIPEATPARKPATVSREPGGAMRQPVRVRIHYLVGNHDWFYHLPGTAYNQIRKNIVDAMGCITPPEKPFPHDPTESADLIRIYEAHQVFARHGDIFDPFNFEHNRDASSLGDAIVVEVVDRFGMRVKQALEKELPAACIAGFREIDNLRPTIVIPVWIDGWLQKTCPDLSLQEKVKNLWDMLVDDFLKIDFARQHCSIFRPFSPVEDLEWGLKFSRGVVRADLSRLLAWFSEKLGGNERSYYHHACGEDAFKSRWARFIVYGHTHQYELVPLDSTRMGGAYFDQVYINSGTWRPYHELSRPHPEQEEFVGYHLLTYLAFYKGNERGGRRFETWTGVLGLRDAAST
jgi:hypothetical protein